MAQIDIQNLTFSYGYGSENVFENINFSFDTNWKIGLIGRNGRGKTTFLKLLLGEYEYSGKITGKINFDYFPIEIQNKDRQTIEILSEIYADYEIWEVMKKLGELETSDDILYQNFSTLSCGEQTKVLLALLFTKENSFLLIDEPTNHLDQNTRLCVKNFLAKQKGFVVVSHDRAFVDDCVDHIISINKNTVDVQKGNFSSWWQNKQNEDKFELSQNEKLKADIKNLQESVARTENWAGKIENTKNGTRISGVKADKGHIGHQAAKMMQRSKAIEKRQNRAIEEKSKLLKNIDWQEEVKFNSIDFSGEYVLSVKHGTVKYGEKIVAKNINFCVQKGDRVAICGKNGSGKSSILKIIVGEKIDHDGIFAKSSKLKISYISQNYDHLSGTLFDFVESHSFDKSKFFTILRKLGFQREQFEHNIEDFSAGQKKKVLLAKSLCEEANVYVWDEPLNYVDVISRIQIENLIVSSGVTMVFVEHDETFIKNIATKIVNI